LGVLNFREHLLVEAEVLYRVASDIDFLDAVKGFAVLNRGRKT
jgi:hypothetical protein